MPGLLLDLKHAWRGLLKAPAFTLAAVLTLALGIGANSAMFSAIDALLLRPLPYPHPERLVVVHEINGRGETSPFSGANFLDLRDRAQTFEGLAAYGDRLLTLSGWGQPEAIMAGRVTAGYFELFALKPSAGTFFTRGQETPGEDGVVVLSQEFWRRRFGGDPSAIGRSLVLNGQACTILGVAPASTPFPDATMPEVFVPLPRDLQNRGSHMFLAVGRLREGVALAQAASELKVIADDLGQQFPAMNRGRSMGCEDLHEVMAENSGRSLLLLMGAVALFLLIAVANVASLFLARTAARRHDVAVRVSLGATSFHLARTFLAEGFLVAAAGTVLGLAGARSILAGLAGLLPAAGGLKNLQPIQLDGTVLCVTSVISLGIMALFCMAPMAAVRGASLQPGLTAGGRSATPRGGGLRASLVTLEVAMATLLLLASGLLLHGFLKLTASDPGFQSRNVTVFSYRLAGPRYASDDSQAIFQRALLDRVKALPGVEDAGTAWIRPCSEFGATTVYHDGPTEELHTTWPTTPVNAVDEGYFRTLRIPLKAGRTFGETDTTSAPKVLLVNEAFARNLHPGPVLGRRLEVGFSTVAAPERTLWEIVGIVGDTRSGGLDQPAQPTLYLPLTQVPVDAGTVLLRSRVPASALAGSLREQLAAVDPQLAAIRIESLETAARELLLDRRQTMLLLGLFALMALFLGAIGIYGLLAYSVAQRFRELGIRMALGARGQQILGLVMGQGLRLVALGLALGVVAYLAAGRVLAHLVVDLSTWDPVTLAAVPILLAAVGFLACLLPALRAARVDPATALRND